MAANEIAAAALTLGMGREIYKQESIDLLAENTRQGMVLQPSNTQKIEFVCSCCGCCCGMLSIQKQLPRPLDFWASNYYAVLDLDKCTRCGICAKKCQVGAITVKKKNKKVAAINLNVKKCIGCGNCVAACKFDALSLIKKDNEAIPPKTFEELNETLMKNKKGTWEKVKMVSKLVLGLPQ
jgi:ferredoxin